MTSRLPTVLLIQFGAFACFSPWRRRCVEPYRLDDVIALDFEVGFLILSTYNLWEKTAAARFVFAFADDDLGV